jgi:hypothetical protein
VIRLVAIREKYGDSAQIAKVTRAGVPEPGINVAWHWPDAAVQNIPNQWDAHYELAPTNANGEVGPGMGRGAYHAVGTPGPHAMWVVSPSTKSDAVFGLGMITLTDHHHVDLVFNITVQEAEVAETPTTPTPGTTPGTEPATITAIRWHSEQAVRDIEAMQIVLSDIRKRLVEQVIGPAYALEGVTPPT